MTEFDASRFGSQYPDYPEGLPEVLQMMRSTGVVPVDGR